ncbi:GNAT family N-acetyltransferase [Halomonas urumqiensis]|uniref:GNAT family N-acetyltransferase n=1 Tax=Halomonas urumqiensis TaxID=1684789 RepID=A0A2N7UPR7_9GAMM|nr:GNAT family N-acetyltransferase [Halomonas urumqiensis]PMR82438.1 GNAT family N-acetyltransferase [Halomonas urumqiensis]PTB04081.1 N-acetyltransferase [Halomonas urumqiensis]GHE19655.1 N-acetyltransferase [Halomonas urumqiensis]
MTTIRPFETGDWPTLWPIIEAIFRAGETYAVPRHISEQDAHRMWIELPRAIRVVVDAQGEAIGSYYLKANQSGPGDHVANCGYVVAAHARGQGIAGAMCKHSLTLARELGFTAMQYNLVVASNTVAIGLWQKHGFTIAGTLPLAFRHPEQGLVDAHVMYRLL